MPAQEETQTVSKVKWVLDDKGDMRDLQDRAFELGLSTDLKMVPPSIADTAANVVQLQIDRPIDRMAPLILNLGMTVCLITDGDTLISLEQVVE